ncbi:MAG: MFS transporter [Collimonas sp.]|uniref:MFS transporter n=1 Tax=Collimonas sp. TaxID=1963772 RepID=UPI0032642A53
MKKISGLRWWIIGMVILCTVINYLARNSLAVMSVHLMQELHFDTRQYALIVNAFQAGYMIMQPVCGMVMDMIGLRAGLALFAVGWSLACAGHVFATGWVGLAGFRLLLGMTEAAVIPAGVKAVGEWFPRQERSVAVGYKNAGTSIGAMAAPPIVVFLMTMYNWEMAFLVIGVAGILWAVLWCSFYRLPADHKHLSEAERGMILNGQDAPIPVGQRKKPSVKKILTTRHFWAIAIPKFLTEPAWQIFSFFIPLFLMKERGMDLKSIALFAWVPFLAADMGGVLGGYLSPIYMKYFKIDLIRARVWAMGSGAFCMIAPGFIGWALNPYLAIGLFCIGTFAHQIISVQFSTLVTDVFPTSEQATTSGFTGMAAWAGGLTVTAIVGLVVDKVGYTPIFISLSVLDLLGLAVLFLLIRDRFERRPSLVPATV